MAHKQILSNETQNSHGFVVLNDSIIWDRYRKNPILLRDPRWGGHDGMPVGRVENVRLEGKNWVGDIVFGTSELAKETEKLYDEGILNAVSICGPCSVAETKSGKRVSTRFEVWEISLVNIPANPDAIAVRDKKGLSAEFVPKTVTNVVALSAEERNMVEKFEAMDEQNNKNADADVQQEDYISLTALDRLRKMFGFGVPTVAAVDAPADDVQPLDAGECGGDGCTGNGETVQPIPGVPVTAQLDASDDNEPDDDDDDEEENEEEQPADAKEKLAGAKEPAKEPVDTGAEEEAKEPAEAGNKGLSAPRIMPLPSNNQTKTKNMPKVPFSQYAADKANASKFNRIAGLSAAFDGNGTPAQLSAQNTADIRDDVRELAAAMLADRDFMTAVENTRLDINGGRAVTAAETIQKLASGEGSATFIESADLAKIIWLGLWVPQLFPNDEWAARVRRVSVADKEGIIWVQSAVNPDVYFGDRAPLDAPNYLYDDTARGLSRKVFSLQPIVWQSANSDILAYNDRATGMRDAMRKLASNIHNYWLQVIAEAVPATSILEMSGDAFAAQNKFPINPSATGNIKGMTVNDLIAAAGKFIAQNLNFRRGSGVCVLAEPYFTSLQQQAPIQNLLTRQLSDSRPDGFTYGGFDVLARSFVAGFNTQTNTVIDLEKYFDKPVTFSDGSIDSEHTAPVLAATMYDIGLAFMPDQVLVGIGNTNIHMVADPNNYGWKFSMDMSTGAGTLRENAEGVVLFRPTVQA